MKEQLYVPPMAIPVEVNMEGMVCQSQNNVSMPDYNTGSALEW